MTRRPHDQTTNTDGLWEGILVDMPEVNPLAVYVNLRHGGFSHKLAMKLVAGMYKKSDVNAEFIITEVNHNDKTITISGTS